MNSKKNAATIRDVAKKAGVSVATVSRVFNSSDLVVAKTEGRIRKIAAELNYVPSASARSLSLRKTETVGLVLPDMYGDFFSEIIRGTDLTTRSHKYHLIVSSSHSNTEELDRAFKTLSGRVDGMIIMSPNLDSSVHLDSVLNMLPTVIIGSTSVLRQTDHLNIDNVGGAAQVVTYLVKQGHRRIGLIRGELGNQDAEERLRGYQEALIKHGIPVLDELITVGDFTEQSGYDCAKMLLTRNERPTAIFCSNDSMAIGALSALREAGLRIPEEMSVCGFDDIPVAKFLNPPLTSVHVPIYEMGSKAAVRLFERLQNPSLWTASHILVPTSLSIRKSCNSINPMSYKLKEETAA